MSGIHTRWPHRAMWRNSPKRAPNPLSVVEKATATATRSYLLVTRDWGRSKVWVGHWNGGQLRLRLRVLRIFGDRSVAPCSTISPSRSPADKDQRLSVTAPAIWQSTADFIDLHANELPADLNDPKADQTKQMEDFGMMGVVPTCCPLVGVAEVANSLTTCLSRLGAASR